MQHQELRRDDDDGDAGGSSDFKAAAAVAPETAAASALLRLADGTQGKGAAFEVRLNRNTGMVKKMDRGLRELTPVSRGSHDHTT